MAQTKAFQWYQYDMPVAMPGMKADATADVVDSYTAEAALNPGDAVILGTDPQWQVKPAATAGDGANVVGIAVHTHKSYEGSGAYYEKDYTLPVMTFGDVYVQAAGTVTAGTQAAISIGTQGAGFVSVGYASAESLAGMKYMTSGSEGDMVVVRVRK